LTFYPTVGRAALQKRIMALLRQLDQQTAGNIQVQHFWLCPSLPVHRGNNHCTPFFTNLCLAVEHSWVFCIGSCGLVHEDRAAFLT